MRELESDYRDHRDSCRPPGYIHRQGSFDLYQLGKKRTTISIFANLSDERGTSFLWDSPNGFGEVSDPY